MPAYLGRLPGIKPLNLFYQRGDPAKEVQLKLICMQFFMIKHLPAFHQNHKGTGMD